MSVSVGEVARPTLRVRGLLGQAEAATWPTMRFVPVKSDAQSDIQALHRARSRLVAERAALINHLRALLLERGIVMAQGRRKLEDALSVFADENDPRLSSRIRALSERRK